MGEQGSHGDDAEHAIAATFSKPKRLLRFASQWRIQPATRPQSLPPAENEGPESRIMLGQGTLMRATSVKSCICIANCRAMRRNCEVLRLRHAAITAASKGRQVASRSVGWLAAPRAFAIRPTVETPLAPGTITAHASNRACDAANFTAQAQLDTDTAVELVK